MFFRIGFVAMGVVLAIVWASQEQRWRTLTEIDPVKFVCLLGIFVVGQILVGFRWWILLRSQSIFVPFFSAVRLHFLGLFYNNCMPGAVGGDLVRAWYVTKHTDKKFEAALCVFVDRVIGLASTLIIAVVCYSFFIRGKSLPISSRQEGGVRDFLVEHKAFFLWVIIFIILVFCVFLLHSRGRAMLRKVFLLISERILRIAERFKKAIFLYCKKPLTLFLAFGLTVFMQLTTITGFWFVGRSLGIAASVKYYYVFFTLTWVLGAIPISIGGAVVVEGMLMVLFIEFTGAAEKSAFALALSQRFVWILTSLPGGLIHLVGAHLPSLPNGDKMGKDG